MTELPAVSLTAESFAADAVTVLYVEKRSDGPVLHQPDDVRSPGHSLEDLGVTGAAGQSLRILMGSEDSGEVHKVLLVGLGDREPLGAESLRRAAGVAARALSHETSVIHALADADADQVAALATGHLLGSYEFRAFRTEGHASEITNVAILGPEDAQETLAAAVAVAQIVRAVRDLGNTPPSDLVPEEFAARVLSMCEGTGVEVDVWDEQRLADESCGGILGVGQGSANPPRLVKLSYSPADARGHIALVGKGITFDTGGLSLKPAASMVNMKYDMCGAAAALGGVLAAAALKLPVQLTAFLCVAENMPSGDAIKPDDVLRMRNGLTVEVTNTDAEGRLVMADGLSLASELKPNLMIDLATLTGAAVVALGDRTTGVMGNSEKWRDRMAQAGVTAGEPMATLATPEEIPAKLDSTVADLVNSKPGSRAGGMLFAAAFLERFVGDDDQGEPLPWLHLDIAGPAQNLESVYGYTPKGATGVPVRSLVELFSTF